MRTTTKRLVAVGAVTALLLGVAGGAYAYWTITGSGTGAGSTGSNEAITINQTSVVTDLQPGGTPQALSGTFTNTNDGPVYVDTVTVSISSISGGDGPSCSALDYVLANAVMTVGAEVPAGTGVGSWSGATIAFLNDPLVNQDDCKNATVNLAYTSN